MSVTLTRKGNEVFYGAAQLTINPQASKGAGNEVVNIAGIPGTNGQKWISLSKLREGDNTLELKGRDIVATGSYTLTPEEKTQVDALQAQIDAIKEAARARYVAKPKFVSPDALTPEQREAKAKEIEAYLKALRGE